MHFLFHLTIFAKNIHSKTNCRLKHPFRNPYVTDGLFGLYRMGESIFSQLAGIFHFYLIFNRNSYKQITKVIEKQ